MGAQDIGAAREALDTAAEAYGAILEELEAHAEALEEYGPDSVGALDVSEPVAVAEGAILDFREALGDPDPAQRHAAIGAAFLQECKERGMRHGADGREDSRSRLSDGLARDGFRALVARFLP